MSLEDRLKKLPPADLAKVQEAVKKTIEATKQFFTDMGLTEEQVKAGHAAFDKFAAEKLNNQKYNFYKTPLARKMFILGLYAQKGSAAWSSYTAKK